MEGGIEIRFKGLLKTCETRQLLNCPAFELVTDLGHSSHVLQDIFDLPHLQKDATHDLHYLREALIHSRGT